MHHPFLRRLLFGWVLGILILFSGEQHLALSQGPLPSNSPRPDILTAAANGTWPAQVVGATGAIQPSIYGPQAAKPNATNPRHAYSPFDATNNLEHPCPPGGCDYQKGRVLIKLASPVLGPSPKAPGGLTTAATVNSLLSANGVVRLESVFPGASSPKLNEMIESPQGKALPKPDLTRWYRAVLHDENVDVNSVVRALSASPGIAWVEPDYLRKPVGDLIPQRLAGSGLELKPSTTLTFTDPLVNQQWHLAAVNAPQAWGYLQSLGLPPGGSRDIVVAVIDTGIDLNHPDLAANQWTNSREIPGNGIDDDADGYVDDVHGVTVVSGQVSGNPTDDNGHGTHVAGIIAAQANNGRGGVGVAYNVQIMSIKAAQYSGVLAASDIAAGVNYAVAHGADVINMSFGGYARSQVEEDALSVAFGQAVLVASAGNDGIPNLPCDDGGRDLYPAAYNWVLGVMASTPAGDLAWFSNWDCIPHDTHEYELMAPGVDILSTLPNEQYAAWDGTSMSAPIVSGIAALVRTKFADKNIYSSRFIMGQIAANASPVANAYAALTVAPKPQLSYLQAWLFDTTAQSSDNNNDGIVNSGETIDLGIVIRNYWGTANPVMVTLQAQAEGAFQPDPFVTMVTNTVSYGAIGSFSQDDNGLIYDAQGVITGVRSPFRFTVPITAPNDSVIPFLVTMTARNGLDVTDPTIYTFQSRFELIVERGRELPRFISQDMVLTKDDFWIVAGPTLIQAGATVTITEGTQVQLGSPNPTSPYSKASFPYIQVEGKLVVQGTLDSPVELFGIASSPYRRVDMRNFGITTLNYVKVSDPLLGSGMVYGLYAPLTSIVHSYFATDRMMIGVDDDRWTVASNVLSRSTLSRMPGESNCCGSRGEGVFGNMNIDTSLINIVSYIGCCPWLPGGSYFLESQSGNSNSLNGGISDSVILPGNEYNATITMGLGGTGLSYGNYCTNCAFLSKVWDPDISHWLRFEVNASSPRGAVHHLENNYWGTTSPTLIDSMIYDYNDNFNIGSVSYQPIITTPPATTYPFVWDVALSTATLARTSVVGAELATFTVTFNRDMDSSVQPQVSFGPDLPTTDFTIHPINGGWITPRSWTGTFNVTPATGDGFQLIRIAGARAADDPWLVVGIDAGRFRFEIITSGTESMNLQATGGEGHVDLGWTQTDFDLLAGFNLYRATASNGSYTRINSTIVPPQQRSWQDGAVQPGQPYYYKFTVVKSDMSESGFSNVAQATPLDTVPPVISHTPVTAAPPGLPLTLDAAVTDNVSVQGVILFFRAIGAATFTSRSMIHTTGSQYAATLEGSLLTAPGLQYYIEATDGITTVRFGGPANPYQITVVDQPIVTSVSPNRGPAAGGTMLTVAGSNFKSGASVTLGGAPCLGATMLSSSQLSCTTTPHFPSAVDVTVVNTDTLSNTLLNGFTYESDVAFLSLPDTGGERNAIVQVPVYLANVQGLAAADLTITFDGNVLNVQGAHTGSLTPGWSLVANTNTPGQVRLAMASSGGTISATGTLALLDFLVAGTTGATTTLHISNALLNDGAIPLQLADGSFAVNQVYQVSGAVHYWNGNAVVPGVNLTLDGDSVHIGLSDATGTFTVTGVPSGTYTLTPSKSDGANGITAYDASLVLQHAAGLITLSGSAAVAADVNKNGTINSFDAFYILQKAVDLIPLPFPGAGKTWEFSPSGRTYASLTANQVGQDFTGILLGDVSGNWSAAGTLARPSLASSTVLRTSSGLPNASGLVTVTVWMDAPSVQVYSLDLQLHYETLEATAVAVQQGPLANGFAMSTNLYLPGDVRVAMAGSLPISGSGELLTLTFQLSPSRHGRSVLTFLRGDINEGNVPATLVPGFIGAQQVYLPLILAH